MGGQAEISYWTAPWARGAGVCSRAVAAVTDWVLVEAGFHRLELGHSASTQASCHVAPGLVSCRRAFAATRCCMRMAGTTRIFTLAPDRTLSAAARRAGRKQVRRQGISWRTSASSRYPRSRTRPPSPPRWPPQPSMGAGVRHTVRDHSRRGASHTPQMDTTWHNENIPGDRSRAATLEP
ncbi:GNAT family protein [Streptomyces sp. NPDC002994]|uniref:GNAT family N-acetyltransferase n=1 Tax=Streptomyces sp. NPDC002994 TaxID=3154441 RepID=UPI0033BA6F73